MTQPGRVLVHPFYIDEVPVEIEFAVERGDPVALAAVLIDGTRVSLDDATRAAFENDMRPRILAAVL